MTFLLFIRRLHLYCGLFLLPWVVLFGVSSYPFSHPVQQPLIWKVRFDRPYTLDVAPGADLRTVGARIHAEAGFSGGFYVNQPNPKRINVSHPDFFGTTRITYFVDERRLLAEDREFQWRSFLASMHGHAGYELHSLLAAVLALREAGAEVWGEWLMAGEDGEAFAAAARERWGGDFDQTL